MARSPLPVTAGLPLLLAVIGCSSLTHSNVRPEPPPVPCAVPDKLTERERINWTANLGDPPLPVAAPETLGRSPASPPYQCLNALACQCMALHSSSMANMMAIERQSAASREEAARKHCNQSAAAAAEIEGIVLYYLSLEDQNRSAAEALNKYYGLGLAEADHDLLRQGLDSADAALVKARAIKARGLAMPVDETELYSQQVDLQAQAVQARLTIDQLNKDLRLALGYCPADAEWRFWPSDAFLVTAETVVADSEIAAGLAHRPELIMLRLIKQKLNSSNAGAVQKLLKSINGLLGMSKPPPLCPMLQALLTEIHDCCAEPAELEVVRRQLHEYHARREKEVVEGIGHAVRTIQAEMELIVLARQQAKSWASRLRESEDKEKKGVGSFAETAESKTKWLRACRKVLEEMANLQRARVMLRHEQGILPAECASVSAGVDPAVPH